MRVDMVQFSKIDIMKNVKKDKSIDKKEVVEDKSFENVLNDRKKIEEPQKDEPKELKKVSKKEVGLEERDDFTKIENKGTDSVEDTEIIEESADSEINFEDASVETLIAMLLIATNNSKINDDGSKIKFDIESNIETLTILGNDKGFVNGVKETLNQFVSKENFGKFNLEFLEGNNLLSEKLDMKLPVAETFENLVNEMKLVNGDSTINKNDFDLNQVKELIVKALNEKDLSNEDIKALNVSLKLVKASNSSDVIKTASDVAILDKTKVVDNLNQEVSNEKSDVVINQRPVVESSKLNQENASNTNSKESFNSKDGESKEDEFLSKLLTEDKSGFDLNLQRMKDFSNIQKVDSKMPINKDSINMDIKNTVLNMTKVNMKEMIVKVNPGNLGEISIKLMAEADSMKAVIKVNSKETYALISAQDIKQHLSNENIKISNVEIELYKEDTTFFSESNEFLNKDESKRNYGETSKNEFMEFEDEEEEGITLSSLDIII